MSVMTAPDRSLDQRRNALAVANQVRTERAQSKRDILAGRVSPASILTDPPAYWQTAKILDLLMAVPMVGRVKALKAINQSKISPAKTVGGLTDRQRKELVFWFRW